MSAESISYTTAASPLGPLLLAWCTDGLTHINFQEGEAPITITPDWKRATADPFGAAVQLDEYFAGERQAFDLPLRPTGTAFQQQVWEVLSTIPYGQAISYGALALRIGQPQAGRAVGAANSRNPLPIVVPCHRVVGADGTLTGFRGGLHLKEFLLNLERRVLGGPAQGDLFPSCD